MRIILFGMLAILSTAATAEIYRYTDAKGNPVFTDRPPPGNATPVDLPPANTVEMRVSEPAAREEAKPAEQPESAQPYRILRLDGLPEGGVLRANSGSFTVSAQLDPPLRRNHLLRFLFDGKSAAGASSATTLTLENVDRGAHSLQLEILNGERIVQRSATEHFTVQRVHVGSPALRTPPAP